MVRIAIVGAGGVARQHAKGIALAENAEITSVVDINMRNAESLAAEYGAKANEKLDACLDEADAVWICTPPSSHKEFAISAMKSGKHVFCEKPISISLSDAEEIVNCAIATGVMFMIGFNMRFRESYRRLKETIESGVIGDVINFWSHRIGLGAGSTGGWKGYNWRTDRNLMCGMSIESLSHDIDMMRWLVGEVTEVQAVVKESIDELPGFDDNANANISLANGGIANIFASWSSHITQNSRGVIGTKGTAIVEGPGIWDVERIRTKTNEMEQESTETVTNDTLDHTSYYKENLYFINCMERGTKPEPDADDGYTALKISHAIIESARSRKAVRI